MSTFRGTPNCTGAHAQDWVLRQKCRRAILATAILASQAKVEAMVENPNDELLERAREAGTLPQEQRRRELAREPVPTCPQCHRWVGHGMPHDCAEVILGPEAAFKFCGGVRPASRLAHRPRSLSRFALADLSAFAAWLAPLQRDTPSRPTICRSPSPPPRRSRRPGTSAQMAFAAAMCLSVKNRSRSTPRHAAWSVQLSDKWGPPVRCLSAAPGSRRGDTDAGPRRERSSGKRTNPARQSSGRGEG